MKKMLLIIKEFCGTFFAMSILGIMLGGCNSDTTYDPSTPREVFCRIQYTGATYAPFHREAPYKYALYDADDKFLAYLDTSKLVLPRMDSYMGKYVEVRGPIVKLDGEIVMRAESIVRRN